MTKAKNNSFVFRNADLSDADACWAIVGDAKAMMNRMGRDQWRGDYPAPSNILNDIASGVARILLLDGVPVAYGAVIFSGEKCYDTISHGTWLTDSTSVHCTYATLHRLAVSPQSWGNGYATIFFEKALEEARSMGCLSMRVDTNYDNAMMLHLLPKIGFSPCGIVMLPGGERKAFEIML